MRTSILSRSVVAIASLAVGSVALAVAPANAASAAGVTHDQILTAVNGFRASQANDTDPSAAAKRALRDIVIRGCNIILADGESPDGFNTIAVTNAGDDADGILISAYVDSDTWDGRYCTIAAFAPADGTFQLSGSATLTGQVYDEQTGQYAPPATVQTSALSGDAFITAPIGSYVANLTLTASGNAVKTTQVATTTKVADKKTKAEKKAAKSTYSKKLKSAKKSYTKALDKAGKSKAKKAAAKKAYAKKRAAAKTAYKYAVASYKIVKSTKTVTETPRPFSLTTVQPELN